MANKIPQSVEPHIDSIISHANEHPWLINFYLTHIRGSITKAIEQEIFLSESFAQAHPNSKPLDKLLFIRDYFDATKNKNTIYEPLNQVFNNIGYTQKLLQDTWLKAMALAQGPISLHEGLPSYTHEVLREVFMREILMYIRRHAKHLQYPDTASQEKLSALKYWYEKELQHLGPVTSPTELDVKRFSKIHDPGHYEVDISSMLSNAWYFINGVDRIPVFLQYELLSIKRAFSELSEMAHALSKNNEHYYRHLFISLPLSTLKFVFFLVYMMFVPYRFTRTMVNELTGLFKQFMGRFLPTSTQHGRESALLKGLGLCLEWLCYGSLIWLCGLPLLPNPFSWMPVIPMSLIYLGATGFLFSVVTGALALALGSMIEHNPIPILEASVGEVEAQVERGIQAVDDVHQRLFKSQKLFTPSFDSTQALASDGAMQHSGNDPDRFYSANEKYPRP